MASLLPPAIRVPFLVETLASVAAQTRLPTSVVVVDDGSDEDIVAESAAGFPTVTLIRQEPLGRSTARNCGASATDSDFLLFLDADDMLRPEALKVMGATLHADPALEMVHGRVLESSITASRRPGCATAMLRCFCALAGQRSFADRCGSRVGGMDERFPRGEWIDWISRAEQNGAAIAPLDDIVLERHLHAFNSVTPGDDDAHYLSVIRAAILRKRLEKTS